MGTRAIINFVDNQDQISIFQHWDGFPETVKANIEKAKKLAWPLPRFEANEFAAAYVAANKTGEGNIRIFDDPDYIDAAFVYLVRLNKKGNLSIITYKQK